MRTLEELERHAYITGNTELAAAYAHRSDEYEEDLAQARHEVEQAEGEARRAQRAFDDADAKCAALEADAKVIKEAAVKVREAAALLEALC